MIIQIVNKSGTTENFNIGTAKIVHPQDLTKEHSIFVLRGETATQETVLIHMELAEITALFGEMFCSQQKGIVS